MARFKVLVAIVVEGDNQQDAIDIVDAALCDVLFEYDDRLRSRWFEVVQDWEDDDEDQDSAE